MKVWGQVEERVRDVLVVASGPSAGRIDWARQRIPEGCAVISVNGTLPHVRAATHWMSCDLSAPNLQILRAPRAGVRYYVAVGPSHARVDWHATYLRVVPMDCEAYDRFGLSEDPGVLHGGNSAFAALGLAYLMGARRVGLLGVDGSGAPYWYGGNARPRSLHRLDGLFRSALPQLRARGVEVLNGSPASGVRAFPRASPESVLRWISAPRSIVALPLGVI